MTNEEARSLRPGDKIRITTDMDPTRWRYADSSGIMKRLAGRIFTVATVDQCDGEPFIQVQDNGGKHWNWFPSMIDFVKSATPPIDVSSII